MERDQKKSQIPHWLGEGRTFKKKTVRAEVEGAGAPGSSPVNARQGVGLWASADPLNTDRVLGQQQSKSTRPGLRDRGGMRRYIVNHNRSPWVDVGR